MDQLVMRALPSVERVRQLLGAVSSSGSQVPEALLVAAVRRALDKARSELLAGRLEPDRTMVTSWVVEEARSFASGALAPSLRRVVNGTGVVIHTNLGRSPMGKEALEHIVGVASGYCNLEYDLEAGERGSRYVHAEGLVCRLTGAEAALVVNNNAAAVLLVLTALARGKEVVISRSELIEIGGSFRLPEIMAVGGAMMREVGTTNKTHMSDYKRALGPATGLVMKAHRSNFAVEGFVEEVPRSALVELCRAAKVPFYEDLGSGLMQPVSVLSGREQEVARAVQDGPDLLSFSGDKLLGGPQAGVIVGKKEHISLLKRHPMTRALRPDKMTLGLLEISCISYLDGTWSKKLPVWNMLETPLQELKERAASFAATLSQVPGVTAGVADVSSMVGGGALPTERIPSAAVVFELNGYSETGLSRALRAMEPPVVCRMEQGRCALDLRTILPLDEAVVVSHISQLAAGTPRGSQG